MTLPPPVPRLPMPSGATPGTAAAADDFNARVLRGAALSAEQVTKALERDRRLQIVLYVVLFGVGVATALAAVVRGLLAQSVGEAVASIGIAGLSAASFFSFFLARPLEALERNAIYSQWLTATVTAYWVRLVYLGDAATAGAGVEEAAKDLVADLDKLARRHATATGRAAAPRASADS